MPRALTIAPIVLGVAVTPLLAQERPLDGPAPIVLSQLVGTWTFEMFVPGRDYPFAKGQREFRMMEDSLKLSWTDDYEGTSADGAGFLGYDSRHRAYYLMGVQSGQPTPLLLLGTAAGDTIHFNADEAIGPYRNPPGLYVSSELRMLGPDRFEWIMNGAGWRAEFTRQGGP